MLVGRGLGLASIALLLVATSTAIASEREAWQAPSCNATTVRYEWNKRAAGAPWVAVGPKRSRLEGWLYSYEAYFADGRANRSEGMVVRAGVEEKIGWFSRKWGGTRLDVTGRRLDGDGSFAQRFGAAWQAAWYPSGLKVPEPGCWLLSLRTKGWARQIVVEAIEPAAKGACDATPVTDSGQVVLTPRRSGLLASWGWRTLEGGALLYAGGRTPEGGNTKILWRTNRDASGLLVLRGTQLDGHGEFRQTFTEVHPSGHWPSIPVVPSAGCWLFTVRISGPRTAAGILVARVV